MLLSDDNNNICNVVKCLNLHRCISTIHYYQLQQELHRTENDILGYIFYAKDPSIIAYNRQYLIDTLGFTEEKLDKIETRKDEKGTILTLEIGVLDERVNLLKDIVST